MEMNGSKKIKMLIGTILGNCCVMLIYHYVGDIPTEVMQWIIAGISGTGLGGVLGQGFADGMSKGLTSSQGQKILAADLQKKSLDLAEQSEASVSTSPPMS